MGENKFINNLWLYYRSNRNINTRNALVKYYLHIVAVRAGAMAKKLYPVVQYDDLYSDGVLGLIQAVESFNIDKNIRFATYANHRVLGAIKDGLRDRDYVPRQVRQRNKKFIEKVNSIQQRLGRIPHEEEIRTRMQISQAEFIKRNNDHGRIANLVSLDAKISSQPDFDREVILADVLEYNDIEREVKLNRLDFISLDIIKNLCIRDRTILILYYCDELTFNEIGAAVGLSESRIWQIHLGIIEQLREKLYR